MVSRGFANYGALVYRAPGASAIAGYIIILFCFRLGGERWINIWVKWCVLVLGISEMIFRAITGCVRSKIHLCYVAPILEISSVAAVGQSSQQQ